MTSNTLPFTDLERVYDLLALAIDESDQELEALFFCKLALTLAHNIAEFPVIEDAIRIAQQDLNTMKAQRS